MKLIHLTDLHLVPPAGALYGFNPADRLAAVIDTINREHADSALCVVTGDLADEGEPSAYGLLREILQSLRMPWQLLVGNHDHRENFSNAFPEMGRDRNGFIQSIQDCDAGRLIFLDTLVQGYGHGGRIEWLSARLAETPSSGAFLFAHHPLQPIGMPHFEPAIVRQWPQVMKMIRNAGAVRHIFCGHVHLDINGNWSGVPFSACRGVAHHIIPDFVRKDAQFVENTPAFDVALIDAFGVTIHHLKSSQSPVIARTPEAHFEEEAA
ncbi:phosphodiesterase [Ensifer sp. NBAIM29]|nr:phosphodiesterase [Ensifer sp. NBAIM29]